MMDIDAEGRVSGASTLYRSTDSAPEVVDGSVIRFKLSDASVALDGHTLAANGWDLARAQQNCPVLWAHDSDNVLSVLGQWENFAVRDGSLYADARFMPRALNPLAGTVSDMVSGGWLRMCSVGFVPTQGRRSNDPSRDGYDFTAQTLLEASIVPVGSLASALVEARSAGVDTGPVFQWAQTALSRGDLAEMRKAAKMPEPSTRSLFDVADLAYILVQLGYLEDSVEWEAGIEGDGSDIPARLTDALRALGQVLVDMTAEEVAEMFAEEDAPGEDMGMMAMAAPRRALVAITRMGRLSRNAPDRVTVELDVVPSAATRGVLEALARAGRVLSSDNEASLRQAADLISGVLSQVVAAAAEPETLAADVSAEIDRQRAAARVKVLRFKAA
jgi:phage head maturation protease